MKTFHLVSLDIVEEKNDDITQRGIKLKGGLIIDREDDQGQWVVEAYVDNSYRDYFRAICNNNEEIMIQVKITKKSNRLATFLMKPLDTNPIGEDINVIFMGTIVDRQREQIEEKLKLLMDEGFQGDELLEEFKKRGSHSSD